MVGQDIPVRQEQYARAARSIAGQIPAAVEELPGNLKGDERLARARRQREQDAILLGGDGLQRPFNCQVLIIACLEKSAPVLKRDLGEAVPPGVCFGEG